MSLYNSDGENVEGGKDLRQQAGEIMACKYIDTHIVHTLCLEDYFFCNKDFLMQPSFHVLSSLLPCTK